jgi:GNAT superfamily N-acetyltransferase
VRLELLQRTDLPAAREVLAVSCPMYRAAEVAEEKLFEPGPKAAPTALGVWDGARLVGVAAYCGDRLRVLGVLPTARARGVGGMLLRACEEGARVAGATRLRSLDEPGNYLAPGLDVRDHIARGWLAHHGWVEKGAPRENLWIDVRHNPQVSASRAEALADAARERGYEIRRAHAEEPGLFDAVAAEFGGAWPFEIARALALPSPGVHVALRDGVICGFAAHDGNNRGLGWFGPAGTWPAHRGQRLGEALLIACLVDVAEAHARCEVAWTGPREFYEKVAGVVGARTFVVVEKAL